MQLEPLDPTVAQTASGVAKTGVKLAGVGGYKSPLEKPRCAPPSKMRRTPSIPDAMMVLDVPATGIAAGAKEDEPCAAGTTAVISTTNVSTFTRLIRPSD